MAFVGRTKSTVTAGIMGVENGGHLEREKQNERRMKESARHESHIGQRATAATRSATPFARLSGRCWSESWGLASVGKIRSFPEDSNPAAAKLRTALLLRSLLLLLLSVASELQPSFKRWTKRP